MSERRKKKREKQDDWLDALTALHMNVAQSEKAKELRDSMNSFLKEYGGMLKEDEKEMLRETLQGIRKTEGVLKRIGGSVIAESVRREEAAKHADERILLKIPQKWIVHISQKAYLIEIPFMENRAENAVWIPKAIVSEDRSGEITAVISRSFSFEKVRYETEGEKHHRVSSSKIYGDDLEVMIADALKNEKKHREEVIHPFRQEMPERDEEDESETVGYRSRGM